MLSYLNLLFDFFFFFFFLRIEHNAIASFGWFLNLKRNWKVEACMQSRTDWYTKVVLTNTRALRLSETVWWWYVRSFPDWLYALATGTIREDELCQWDREWQNGLTTQSTETTGAIIHSAQPELTPVVCGSGCFPAPDQQFIPGAGHQCFSLRNQLIYAMWVDWMFPEFFLKSQPLLHKGYDGCDPRPTSLYQRFFQLVCGLSSVTERNNVLCFEYQNEDSETLLFLPCLPVCYHKPQLRLCSCIQHLNTN